jgi:hypothetical protein
VGGVALFGTRRPSAAEPEQSGELLGGERCAARQRPPPLAAAARGRSSRAAPAKGESAICLRAHIKGFKNIQLILFEIGAERGVGCELPPDAGRLGRLPARPAAQPREQTRPASAARPA